MIGKRILIGAACLMAMQGAVAQRCSMEVFLYLR